jgi:cytochrome bd-type quinol oxidase subunit 2
MTSAKQRKNRAPLNLLMGIIGLLAIMAVIPARMMDAPPYTAAPFVLALIINLSVMFATRKSDEYTLGLWSAGANAAFAVIVAWMLFAPFLEGFYDGLTGNEAGMNFPAEGGSIAAILAFYLVFNIKRLTGAL